MLIKLYNKVKNMIKRAIITNVDKTTKMYKLQIKSHKAVRNATMLMPYGLICDPEINSEGLLFSVGGDGGRMYCIPFNPDLQPDTIKGDVILYSNKTTKITLKKNSNIEISTTKDVSVNCNNLTANVTGDIEATCSNLGATVSGDVTVNCDNISATATTQADITAPAINLTGNVVITGNLSVTGTSTLTGVTTIETKPFLTHIHSGVTSGANNSGGVV
jgi:phage gp45-like